MWDNFKFKTYVDSTVVGSCVKLLKIFDKYKSFSSWLVTAVFDKIFDCQVGMPLKFVH